VILLVLAAIVVGLALWLGHQRQLESAGDDDANRLRWWRGRINNTRGYPPATTAVSMAAIR
jgi:hypothetical protein